MFWKKKTEAEKSVDPFDRITAAVDELNAAWNELKTHDAETLRSVRPWVLWKEKRVVLTRWQSKPEIVYDPEDS